LVFFAGAAGLAATLALALGAAGTGATGADFKAARWSRKALISAPSLFLRSVSLAMLAVILVMALAVLETGAFLAGALTTAFLAGTGAGDFFVVAAALGAAFFAVAIVFNFLFCNLSMKLDRASLSSKKWDVQKLKWKDYRNHASLVEILQQNCQLFRRRYVLTFSLENTNF
jgi:hypothetical protein